MHGQQFIISLGCDQITLFEINTFISSTVTASVPAAGRYTLSFGYSNGLADAASYILTVGDQPPQTMVFQPTQARELIGQSKLEATLPAGMLTITLSAGPDSPKGSLFPSLVEIDYLDITAD